MNSATRSSPSVSSAVARSSSEPPLALKQDASQAKPSKKACNSLDLLRSYSSLMLMVRPFEGPPSDAMELCRINTAQTLEQCLTTAQWWSPVVSRMQE